MLHVSPFKLPWQLGNIHNNMKIFNSSSEGESPPDGRAGASGGQFQRSNQRGVTLVVAIVMLATVTFISFSIATVMIREIVSARLILKTEPAISGANAGGEIGLYLLFREVGGTNVSGPLGLSGANYNVVSELYENPYYFNIPAGSDARIGLYDAENFANPNTGYTSVTITNNTSAQSNPVKVDIFTFANVNAVLYSVTLGTGQNQSFPLNDIDDRYLIVITPTGNFAASGQITAEPNGIPSDAPTITSTGTFGEVQRKIEINLVAP